MNFCYQKVKFTQKDFYIIKEGQTADLCYFIKKGDVEITKKIKLK